MTNNNIFNYKQWSVTMKHITLIAFSQAQFCSRCKDLYFFTTFYFKEP